ncbi:MAG TPA: F0F1 ATP synthase subunit alpha [Clostridiales bacterium]|nr:F0F1 ATP synthase subunit alpha [Clostridiales bacterium]
MADFVVTSAKILSENKKREIIAKLGALPEQVSFRVDEALIGGIVISDGERVLDASVKHRVRAAAENVQVALANKPLEHILSSLKEEFSRSAEKPEKVQAGIVRSVQDGVIFVDGLYKARIGELLLIAGKHFAMAMNLNRDSVGAILLTGLEQVRAGDAVRLTDRIVTVPVGDQLLGRVVGPLGDPIDGGGRIEAKSYRRAESPAPAILDRAKVAEPLYTGVKTIDAIVPIGKGQRELIIGDRQTGKTSLALDAILNQKGKNVYCVYVSIGQKTTTVSDVIKRLKEGDALSYTTVVSATASDSPTLQYVAPYTATAIAEEWMYAGKDVLIVYDDLSKHAVAYRTISLLLKRPAGREAYPGDVFYIHSRLLERSAKLSPKLGGGSLSALPIIETLGSDISSYIPTNVISITDGQIFLESELFHAGVRPAVNVGLSVSRVGGSAQPKAMRKVAQGLKLDLARYREMAIFAQFGADVDEETKALLERGVKLTSLLVQPQGKPYPMAEEVVEIHVMTGKFLADIEKTKVHATLDKVLSHIRANYPDILSELEKTGDLSEELAARIDQAASEVIA